jgi:hypothetical protein
MTFELVDYDSVWPEQFQEHAGRLTGALDDAALRVPLVDAWRDACREAGLVGRRIHDCRRTAARNYRRLHSALG